ncbi:hypothetical protein ACSLBF_10400 [Pseudoalteromonas sp. T1lg65]|uniref:hypothetical protein n=1 Tax=Pseudoalteromonas sp. T1lg65 TaxID=2077101 RepID=UPI003F7A6B75
MTIKDQVAPKKRRVEEISTEKQAGKTVLLMSMEQLKNLIAQGSRSQGERA